MKEGGRVLVQQPLCIVLFIILHDNTNNRLCVTFYIQINHANKITTAVNKHGYVCMQVSSMRPFCDSIFLSLGTQGTQGRVLESRQRLKRWLSFWRCCSLILLLLLTKVVFLWSCLDFKPLILWAVHLLLLPISSSLLPVKLYDLKCSNADVLLTCYDVPVAVFGTILLLLGHVPGGRLALKEALYHQQHTK